jgi:acyl-CoA synthetase (AMP-forming)/AMP-acid ligase II
MKIKNVIVTSLRDYLPQKPILPFPAEMEQPKASFPEALNFLDFLADSSPELPSQFTDLKEEDIIDWTKDNMASYKRPRIVEFRDAFPKNAAGKILKRALVEEEREKAKKNTRTVK